MSHSDNPHLKFRKEVLDSISSSFCAAKWLNATIWLNSGMTASCHHPIPHHIPLHELEKDPTAIHNTEHKKRMRAMMLKGHRPPECEYCWKIEDIGKDHISDRVFKSEIYSNEAIQKIANLPWDESVTLETLEIAFDRTCNFACSYCSPHFSSTWAQDIKKNGPYQNLPTDTYNHYISDQSQVDQYKNKNNPYVEAFWKWWPQLKINLKQLRITGGEPFLSPHVWRLLEDIDIENLNEMKLAINSNLGWEEKTLEKLIAVSQRVPHLEIYTSNESFGSSAEYIRDGLNWQRWTSNIENLLERGNIKALHMMMTVSCLALFSITEFLDQILDWKKKSKIPVIFSVNIMRHPVFQSVFALPAEMRSQFSDQISQWTYKNRSLLLDFEISSLERFSDYLTSVEKGTERSSPQPVLARDLKRFIVQYDQRREKSYKSSLPKVAVQWIESLSEEAP